jgi:hypothetical protein
LQFWDVFCTFVSWRAQSSSLIWEEKLTCISTFQQRISISRTIIIFPRIGRTECWCNSLTKSLI